MQLGWHVLVGSLLPVPVPMPVPGTELPAFRSVDQKEGRRMCGSAGNAWRGRQRGADPACIRRLLSRKAAALPCCQPVCILMPMMYLWRRVAFASSTPSLPFPLRTPPFLNEKDTPVPSSVSFSKVWLSMGLLSSGRPTTCVLALRWPQAGRLCV